MKRARAVASAALLVAVTAAIHGCGFADEGTALIYNDCRDDAECVDGVCDQGLCIAASPEALAIALEVVPQSGSLEAAPGSWVYETLTVDGPTLRALALPSRLKVTGTVTHEGMPVPCTVSFTRTSVLPGAAPVTVVANAPDYHVEVIAGEHYEVAVQPSGQAMDGTGVPWLAALPPLYYAFDAPEGDPLNPGAVLATTLTIPYPTPVAFEGVVLDLDDLPQSDLQVRAVEKTTGRVVSSVATTAADGSFTLAVLPTAGAYVLRIQGASSRPTHPTVDIDPALLFPGTPSVIRIPAVGAVSLQGLVEDENERPIQNALVELRSTALAGLDLGTVASFRTSVSTSSDPDTIGRFEVDVPPGAYDVIVTPSGTTCEGDTCTSTEDLAVLATAVDLNASLGGALFVLPDRARLGGRATTADERTMAEMPVQAVARQILLPGGASIAPLFNRSSASSTDATGRFDVRLDLGVYDLYVKPPTASAFPWVVVPRVEVDTLGEPMTAEYTMTLPVPIRGLVTTAAGEPLAAAEVRAHALIEEEGETRSIVVGSATTDADGAYELLLPSRL